MRIGVAMEIGDGDGGGDGCGDGSGDGDGDGDGDPAMRSHRGPFTSNEQIHHACRPFVWRRNFLEEHFNCEFVGL